MAYLKRTADGSFMEMPQGNVQLGDFGWAVRTPVSAEGHEAITRAALGGGAIAFTVAGRPAPPRVLSAAEQNEIVEGNRSVDLGWAGTGTLFAFSKDEQKRHALRREFGQTLPAALADIVGSLTSQHAAILAAASPTDQLRRIGQALHLVQDSFSPAHTERRPAAGWCISYVRNYGRGSFPAEHRVPSDDRDQVARSRSEAAQATAASRRYLQIVFKAIYGRTRPDPAATAEAGAEFSRFVADILRRC